MKLDFERKSVAREASERLKRNLEAAVDCLRDRESSALVNYIVRDVAKLVTVHGETRLKEQYEDILALATDRQGKQTSRSSSSSHQRQDDDLEDDSERLREGNLDLLEKMGMMRDQVRKLEEKRRSEVRAINEELEKCKQLLVETEARLVAERVQNRRLKKELFRSGSSSSLGSEEDDDCNKRFGFGALTVRSFNGREETTSRPISAKSRKHRRD